MAVMELSLAAMLAISAHFQAGAAALKQLDFEKAETEASAIVQAAPAAGPVGDAARILRAKARAGMEHKDAAIEDLRWVGQRSEDPGLRAEALAMFGQLSGGAALPLPARTPRSEFYRVLSDLRRGSAEGAVQRFGGPLRDWIVASGAGLPPPAEGETREGNALKALGAEWMGKGIRPGEERIDAAAGTAELTVLKDQSPVVFALRQTGDAWTFWAIKSLPPPVGLTNAAAAVAVAGLAGNPAAAMANVQFRVMGDHLAQGVAVINGQVLQMGGNAGFVTVTSASGRGPTNAPVADVSTNEVPAEKRAEIAKLIGDLGSPDAAVRARARTRLKELGPAARPFLRERAGDPDVEIATTVRELLGE